MRSSIFERLTDYATRHGALRQRSNSGGSGFSFGDEELEDNIGHSHIQGALDNEMSGGRRLSRDLEAGFRDDSDDEENVGNNRNTTRG